MSVASEFPPEVYIPAAARPRGPRALRVADYPADRSSSLAVPRNPTRFTGPAAPAAAATGAGVVDLDRWRHHYVGAQVGDRRRIDAGLRTRPAVLAQPALTPLGLSAPMIQPAPIVRPAGAISSASLRLTRRGFAVLVAATMFIALTVVAIAWLSAPASAGASADTARAVTVVNDQVTVHAGDSLWTIAAAVAPHRDPRAEVADLQRLNNLSSDTLAPGQHLRVR